MKPKAIFFKIENVAQKLTRIIRIAHYHFLRKEALLILAPNEKAVKYVDELLWKEPIEGFLPHKVATENCSDILVITEKAQNLNNAIFAINLCPQMPLQGFSQVYDFAEKEKRVVFEKKSLQYQKLGYDIETGN